MSDWLEQTSFRKIMVVDDDAPLRERLARALRQRGFEVTTAADVPEALELARQFLPEAVVLDLKMSAAGGPSGLDALRELRTVVPLARSLILTGYGSIATALEAVRLGAWDYLTKPADADQILTALARNPGNPDEAESPPPLPLEAPSLERLEWEHIQRVLSDCGGNVSQAAKVLGLHRRSLQRKLYKYPPER